MSKPRYTKQRDNYGCGPTAILNALRWAGWKAPRNMFYETLVRYCRARPDDGDLDMYGTNSARLDHALGKISSGVFKVKHKSNPKISTIDKHLKEGKAIILLFGHETDGGHYTLIVGKEGHEYVAVNTFIKGKALRNVTRKQMNMFMKRKRKIYPQIWVLTKESV